MPSVSTNIRKAKKKSSDAGSKEDSQLKYVNQRLKKNYGKTNKELPYRKSVEPGVQDTQAVIALREGDTSTVPKKIKIAPSGRPSGEGFAISKMKAKGILDENNKVIPKQKRIKRTPKNG